MSRHPLVLCLLGLASAPAAAFDGFLFQHEDWEVACDNTGTCRAAGYQADGVDPALSVLLERRAGPHAPVAGTLTVGEVDGPVTPRSPVLSIDGRRVGAPLAGSGTYRLEAGHVAALLAALRRDSDIAFDAGDVHWQLSDAGASAVLLKMDEFQGRIGTPGALVRRGQRDEAQVPPPQAPPRVRQVALPEPGAQEARLAVDASFVRALEQARLRDECQPRDEINADAPLTVRRADADRVLVSTTCWQAAYNWGDGYWLVDIAPPHAATLVTIDGTDFASGQITATQKGRGPGDCLGHEAWTWDGTDFVHTEVATTGMCRYVVLGGTWHLTTLVSDVVPAEQAPPSR
jgi:hypothetical protein